MLWGTRRRTSSKWHQYSLFWPVDHEIVARSGTVLLKKKKKIIRNTVETLLQWHSTCTLANRRFIEKGSTTQIPLFHVYCPTESLKLRILSPRSGNWTMLIAYSRYLFRGPSLSSKLFQAKRIISFVSAKGSYQPEQANIWFSFFGTRFTVCMSGRLENTWFTITAKFQNCFIRSGMFNRYSLSSIDKTFEQTTFHTNH